MGGTLSAYGGGVSEPELSLDDLTLVEREVLRYTRPVLDGERVKDLRNVPVEAFLGLIPLDEPDARRQDLTDTLLDPDNDLWDQPDQPDDWIGSEQKARRQIKRAVTSLIEQGVIDFAEVHETDETGAPVDAELVVQRLS